MMQEQEKRGAGRPSDPDRRQRINVTLSTETLIKFHATIPEKQRSEYIERLLRRELGLPEEEGHEMPEFAAYQRSWNAGFVTEVVSVKDGVVVDQIIKTFSAAAQPEIPNLVGTPFDTLRGKRFQRITSQRKIEELRERYEQLQMPQ